MRPPKKNKFRFTIKFDETDPSHCTAADLLNTLKHPSQFIATAINFYQKYSGENSTLSPPEAVILSNNAVQESPYSDEHLSDNADVLTEFFTDITL